MQTGRVFSKCSYEIDGRSLQQTEIKKDLRVIIKDSLSSSGQVVEERNEALRMLGAINNNVSYKSEAVIAKLYCAYVRSHLEYCLQVWSPTYEKDCWLFERVQKRATKMIKCLSSLGSLGVVRGATNSKNDQTPTMEPNNKECANQPSGESAEQPEGVVWPRL